MEYVGGNIETHLQGEKVVVNDFGLGTTSPVFIRSFRKSNVWFQGTVAINTTFDIDATNVGRSRLESTTFVDIFDVEGGTLLQEIEFHTSCSKPIFTEDRYGSIILKSVLLSDGFTTIP